MEFTLKPAADRLAELIDANVTLAPDVIGDEVQSLVKALQPGEILVLENVRFYKEEEGKGCLQEEQETFMKTLASYGDVYVSDAFGTAHRGHASMAVITKYVNLCAAGFLLEKRSRIWVKYWKPRSIHSSRLLEVPKFPVSMIDVIVNLMEKCQTILIGGGMAYTFYAAQGLQIDWRFFIGSR